MLRIFLTYTHVTLIFPLRANSCFPDNWLESSFACSSHFLMFSISILKLGGNGCTRKETHVTWYRFIYSESCKVEIVKNCVFLRSFHWCHSLNCEKLNSPIRVYCREVLYYTFNQISVQWIRFLEEYFVDDNIKIRQTKNR